MFHSVHLFIINYNNFTLNERPTQAGNLKYTVFVFDLETRCSLQLKIWAKTGELLNEKNTPGIPISR